MSNDTATLVGIALDLISRRAAIDKQLGLIKQNLELQFPKDRTEEQITTARGVVIRNVDNSFFIPPRHIYAVRTILGPAQKDLVETTEIFKPTSQLRTMLWNADSVLGRALRPYVEVEQTVHMSFRPPDGNVAVDAQGSVITMGMSDIDPHVSEEREVA